MRILIVAATEPEIGPLISSLQHVKDAVYSLDKHHIEVLITGIGMTATAYQLGRKLALNKYDIALNLGIAGSFNRNINLGDVVNIVSEQFYELGVEDGDEFKDLFSIGLLDHNTMPFTNGMLKNNSACLSVLPSLLVMKGITVSKVHGNAESVATATQRSNADIESMEGAAFMYVCLMEKVEFLQIRAVSNYVEKRNRAAWNIPLAIKNLNETALQLISKL